MSEGIQFDVSSTMMTWIAVALVGVLILVYTAYQWVLSKPIPGIPYNKVAAQRLLGDIPDMVAHVNKTGTISPWITIQALKLNSPIIQLWARPFSKPWVIVYDFKESQDILLRRTKEFDRSDFFGEVFLGLVPDHHISKRSSDPKFKHNRALVKDLMTPGFLNEVAGPQIYAAVETLLELWSTKTQLAKGHPFPAEKDIFHGTLDVIVAATFGLNPEESMLQTQTQFLDSSNEIIVPEDIDKPVEFPETQPPLDFEAILTLTESLETSIKSPYPRFHYWCLQQLPYMRRAFKIKEKMISAEIQKAVQRLQSDDLVQRCAVDDVLRRERALAGKEERQPLYQSREIKDELFGFLIGGHDTTSTTLCWGLKYLTDNPAAQLRFRSELRETFTSAAAEHRYPTANEIISTHNPYLDAVIEEVARLSGSTAGIIRNALVDTTVLGYPIPKGTDVFLMSNGPNYISPSFSVNDADRSEGARSIKGRQVGSWSGDAAEMQAFKPERWLVKDEAGNETFDATAGPHLAFGLGPRGCFGRRLAYLEMRLMLVMIIWTFELKKCPEELSGYAKTDKLTVKPNQFFLRLQKVTV